MNEPLPSRRVLRWWSARALSVSGVSALDRSVVELGGPCGKDRAPSRSPSRVDCIPHREIVLSSGSAGGLDGTKLLARMVAATPSADSPCALSRAEGTGMVTQSARGAAWQGRNREVGTHLRVRSAFGEFA